MNTPTAFAGEEIARIQKRMEPDQCADSGFLAPGDYFPDVICRDSETLMKLGITHEQIADFIESVVSVFFEKLNDDKWVLKFEIFGERFVIQYTEWCGRVSCPFSKGREQKPISKEELLRQLAAKETELHEAEERKLVVFHHPEREPAERELCILNDKIDRCSRDIAKLRNMIENHPELGFEETFHNCGYHGHFDMVLTNWTTKKKVSFPGLMQHLVRDHHFFETGPYRLDPAEFIACAGLKPGVSYKIKKHEEEIWGFNGSSLYMCEYAKNICPVKLPPGLSGKAYIVTNGIMDTRPTLHLMLYTRPSMETCVVDGAVVYTQHAFDNCKYGQDAYYIKSKIKKLTGCFTDVDGFAVLTT